MRLKALMVVIVGVFVAGTALTALPRGQTTTPIQAKKTANVLQTLQQAVSSLTGNGNGVFGQPADTATPVTNPTTTTTTTATPAPTTATPAPAGASATTPVATAGPTQMQADAGFTHLLRRWPRQTTLTPPADLCLLTPPANFLSAQGLATPWQLSGTTGGTPCTEENANTAVFVEATIFDPATGALSAYDPLVVDQGTQPAAAPVVPTLPRNAAVAIWIGANATVVLPGGVRGCTDGTDSVFSQQAYCNVPQFLNAVRGRLNKAATTGNTGGTTTGTTMGTGPGNRGNGNRGNGAGNNRGRGNRGNPGNGMRPMANFIPNFPSGWGGRLPNGQGGRITVPQIGTATDGKPCPTSRDFMIVDQDQSDNDYTHYLVVNGNQVAQDTTANRQQFPNAQITFNGSDEGTVVPGVDAALGCKPWAVTDLADPNQTISTGLLNEIQASVFQGQPVALVPALDDFVTNPSVSLTQDLNKLNNYRQQVDQPRVASLNQANTTTYCQNLLKVGLPRIANDQNLLANQPSPFPATANNLFTFIANRFMATFSSNPGFLQCTNLLHVANPVTVTTDGNGVVTAATINLNPGPNNASPTPTVSPTTTTNPTPTPVGTVTPSPSPNLPVIGRGRGRRGGLPVVG
jgi:hypothetical protein